MRSLASLPLFGLSLSLAALACAADPDPAGTGDTSEDGTSEDGTTEDGTAGDGDGDAEPLRPNWHEDLAPLVHGNCVGCHREGGIAPFSLETYEQAAPWGELLAEAVAEQTMPPWGALDTEECQPTHGWKDDARLSEAQRQLFADWLAADLPEGDPALAVELPEPPNRELEDPDVVLQNPVPYAVDGVEDDFVCMVVDPGNEEDVWITGLQNIADNDEVVHHVLTYVDPDNSSADVVDADGKFICPGGFVSLPGVSQVSTWVPGGVPTRAPEGVGFPMPAGSKLIMAYHYHPTGAGEEVDQSSVAVKWVSAKPDVTGYTAVFGALLGQPSGLLPGPNDPGPEPWFGIPANVPDHIETLAYDLPDILPPIEIFAIGTHMHYVGVDMKIWLERDGEDICLLQTPRYDFGWQRVYDIDAPIGELPYVQGGDRIYLRCEYNNTLSNEALAEVLEQQGYDEPIDIPVGEQSLEEMCGLLVSVATELPIGDFF